MLNSEKNYKSIILMVFCIGFFRPAQAQYISLQGVNITHVLTDNIVIDFDVSSAIGGDLNYSGYLFRNLNYNLGAAYLSAEDAEIFFLKTGISKIYLVPTSFNKAKNKESVSYITNNWLGSLDLNCYNGLLLQGTEVLYVFAAEPAWNLAYMLGKKKRFFIGGVFALRYTLYPGGAYAALSQVGIPVQLGVKYEL